MASTIAHALVAASIGSTVLQRGTDSKIWILGMVLATVPDLDAIGRPFGAGDIDWLGGHRGLSHSLVVATLLALLAGLWVRRIQKDDGRSLRLFGLFFLPAALSHSLIDCATRYGSGVALFAPLMNGRFKYGFVPIDGANEVYWIWLPSLVIITLGLCDLLPKKWTLN